MKKSTRKSVTIPATKTMTMMLTAGRGERGGGIATVMMVLFVIAVTV